MNGTYRFATAALLAGLFAGCVAKKHPTITAPPEPTTAPTVAEDVEHRVKDLRMHADALAEINKKLPGRNVEEDNQLVSQALDYLAAALSDLGGTSPDGALRQQVEIVRGAREKLLTAPLAVSEPTIDTGLRAGNNALVDLHRKQFASDKEIAQLLEQLLGKLPELDKVHDPLHRLPVASVFNGISQVLQAMTRVMETNATAPYPPDPAVPTTTTAPATTRASTGPATTRASTRPFATRATTAPASAPVVRPVSAPAAP